MAGRRKSESDDLNASFSPARTPEQRENQLIFLAEELAERQMRDGTASAQVVTHYLKLGSSRERLEQERIQHEVELMAEKKAALQDRKKMEDLFERAIGAMTAYRGQGPMPGSEDEEEFDD